jgi:hypothetical protein
MVSDEPSMPIFTASTPMSTATARTCPTIASAGTGVMPSTTTVFCQVIAVIAVMPWTPQRANAFRSAWMPAPPPESEPAIDSTLGVRVVAVAIAVKHMRRPRAYPRGAVSVGIGPEALRT